MESGKGFHAFVFRDIYKIVRIVKILIISNI